MPSSKAPNITENASYMNTRRAWSLVKPMARSTPNSQRFSLMLAVVEISSRKNESVSAMNPTMPTKIWKRSRLEATESCSTWLSSRIVRSSRKKERRPFVSWALLSAETEAFSLMKPCSFGI